MIADRPGTIELLVVDDDPAALSRTADRFDERGTFVVTTTDDAAAGINILETTNIDCVVTEYSVAETDGVEFLETVREHFPNLPVFLFTNVDTAAILDEAFAAGVTDILAKDTKRAHDQLVHRIEAALSQRRTQRALDSERDYAEALFEHNSDSIVLVEFDGTDPIVWDVNPAFERVFGYRKADVLGMVLDDVVTPPNRYEEGEEINRRALDGESIRVETRRKTVDGTADFLLRSIAIDESIGLFFVIYTDITDNREYERSLRKMYQAVESAGHSILITDPNGTIEYVNPTFERETGYAESEVLGEDPSLLKSGKHDDTFYQDLWETVTSGEVWHANIVNRRKTGDLYYVDQTIAPVFDEFGEIQHFVGIEVDITQRTQRRQQLEVLNRVFRHNLRTAMNAVAGYGELLASEVDDEKRQSWARTICRNATDLVSLSEKANSIQKHLEYDHNHRGALDVIDLLESVSATTKGEYPAVDISVEGPSRAVISGDGSLELAFSEIVENAIKHCDHDDPAVSIDVDIDHSTSTVWVRISDVGPGIPEYETDVIEQGRESPLLHGSGIGLWIANWIVMHNGGELAIDEQEPRGTVVTFRLPAPDIGAAMAR